MKQTGSYRRHAPRSYKNPKRWREKALTPFAASLAEIGDKATQADAARGARSVHKEDVPRRLYDQDD